MGELRTYSVPVFGVPPEVQARADRINADLDELLTPEARERLDLAVAKTYADATSPNPKAERPKQQNRTNRDP